MTFDEYIQVAMECGALRKQIENREAAAIDAAPLALSVADVSLAAGDAFRLRADVLQRLYGVGLFGFCRAPDECWTALDCACDLCTTGRFVACTTGRHFARAGVERCPATIPLGPSEHAAFLAAEREQLGVDRMELGEDGRFRVWIERGADGQWKAGGHDATR